VWDVPGAGENDVHIENYKLTQGKEAESRKKCAWSFQRFRMRGREGERKREREGERERLGEHVLFAESPGS
jgi:hypothetical protein